MESPNAAQPGDRVSEKSRQGEWFYSVRPVFRSSYCILPFFKLYIYRTESKKKKNGGNRAAREINFALIGTKSVFLNTAENNPPSAIPAVGFAEEKKVFLKLRKDF
jgi:hypothetical protein